MSYAFSLTDMDVFSVLRAVILEVLGGVETEVVRLPTNRTPLPKNFPFVTMAPVRRDQIRWPSIATSEFVEGQDQTQTIAQAINYVIQIDAFGRTAGDVMQTLWGVFQSPDAFELFATKTPAGVYPISANDPHQVPLVDAEAEYETRWIMEVNLQYCPVLTTTVQTASTVSVECINVEATYH